MIIRGHILGFALLTLAGCYDLDRFHFRQADGGAPDAGRPDFGPPARGYTAAGGRSKSEHFILFSSTGQATPVGNGPQHGAQFRHSPGIHGDK